MPLIVSDAGPLIAFSRTGRLPLLRELFGRVLVPNVVIGELRLDEHRPGVELLAEAVRVDKWIEPMEPPAGRSIPGLGEGESAAILLAGRLQCPLLVDERRARVAAGRHGVRVIGTGRVLIAAKQEGLLGTVGEALDALKAAGYRLSDDLCRRLLELAGER